MAKTRVLVVDDDKSILQMLEFGLQKLGPEYQVFTARDMFSALSRIEGEGFDLVLTDYMMPGMTGVDLARAVHRISPDTQVVLMTAYGTSKLRDTSYHIGFDGYLDKPFEVEQVREVVEEMAQKAKTKKEDAATAKNTPPAVRAENASPPDNATPSAAEPDMDTSSIEPEMPSPKKPKTINQQLQELLVNAGARSVILIDAQGKPVQVVGQINSERVVKIGALVASSYMRTSELASLLDNKKYFKSGFYEGDAYNIYVCDVNEESLLTVIFDVKLRPGVVWFYTKQTAVTLASMLSSQKSS